MLLHVVLGPVPTVKQKDPNSTGTTSVTIGDEVFHDVPATIFQQRPLKESHPFRRLLSTSTEEYAKFVYPARSPNECFAGDQQVHILSLAVYIDHSLHMQIRRNLGAAPSGILVAQELLAFAQRAFTPVRTSLFEQFNIVLDIATVEAGTVRSPAPLYWGGENTASSCGDALEMLAQLRALASQQYTPYLLSACFQDNAGVSNFASLCNAEPAAASGADALAVARELGNLLGAQLVTEQVSVGGGIMSSSPSNDGQHYLDMVQFHANNAAQVCRTLNQLTGSSCKTGARLTTSTCGDGILAPGEACECLQRGSTLCGECVSCELATPTIECSTTAVLRQHAKIKDLPATSVDAFVKVSSALLASAECCVLRDSTQRVNTDCSAGTSNRKAGVCGMGGVCLTPCLDLGLTPCGVWNGGCRQRCFNGRTCTHEITAAGGGGNAFINTVNDGTKCEKSAAAWANEPSELFGLPTSCLAGFCAVNTDPPTSPPTAPTQPQPTARPATTSWPTSSAPTSWPTSTPTSWPTSDAPTSKSPTSPPVMVVDPAEEPTVRVTARPTSASPTTKKPTSKAPTTTDKPTSAWPVASPTPRVGGIATEEPTLRFGPITPSPTLTAQPTAKPTSQRPTVKPTVRPTSQRPTAKPTSQKPTVKPSSLAPTVKPSTLPPTIKPTSLQPTVLPTTTTAEQPLPTLKPTIKPTSLQPTIKPTVAASLGPTRKPTTLPPTYKLVTANPASGGGELDGADDEDECRSLTTKSDCNSGRKVQGCEWYHMHTCNYLVYPVACVDYLYGCRAKATFCDFALGPSLDRQMQCNSKAFPCSWNRNKDACGFTTRAPSPPPSASWRCLNSCTHSRGDGQCQDGGENSVGAWCMLGTDCADCGPRWVA